MGRRRLDLAGQTFSYFKVLSLNEEVTKNKGDSFFDCVCVCGQSKVVRGTELVSGNTKSCGCYFLKLSAERSRERKIDFTGKRFTKLVVIKDTGKKHPIPRYGSIWECVCDCGNTKEVAHRYLVFGKIKSCGCLKPSLTLNSENKGARKIYSAYKKRSKLDFGTFDLSLEYFYSLIKKPCFYCGALPNERKLRCRSKSDSIIFAYNGIDRVDNSLGYTPENTVPCCAVCNMMKMDRSQEEFYSQIKRIHEHQKLNEPTNIQLPDYGDVSHQRNLVAH